MSDDNEFINKILAGQDTSASDIEASPVQISNDTSELQHSDGIISLNESFTGISHHTFAKNEKAKENKSDDK